MNLTKAYFLLSLALTLTSCKEDPKENPKPEADPCKSMVEGYIVGFDQCAVGQSFVIATVVSKDTVVTYNLPDSLYHLPATISDPMYAKRLTDFLFPANYRDKYHVRLSFEIVPKESRHHVICVDQFTAHYVHTVKDEIKILCASK